LGQDRLARMLVDLHAYREPDLAVAEVPGEPGAGSGATIADQDRLASCGRWQLGQREVDQGDQIIGGTGAALPGRSMPARGSPGAWPRSR
jgi:hypothetical protein